MPKPFEKTSMGGEQEDFLTTHWSEIFNARTTDEIRQKVVMDNLLRKYWKPVYCCIRYRGYDNEQAKDLTQDFFQEVVLNSNLIQQADPQKGRFRTYLLTILKHYLISVHRKEYARKRMPQTPIQVLESNDLPDLPEARLSMGAEQAFNYAWATQIIDEVINQVEQQCRKTNKIKHWQIFHAKILNPIIKNRPSPAHKELCEKFGIDNETKASNMIITVKRSFRRALEDQLRRFVRADSEVEEELTELLGAVAKGGAG
jgi:RNA polymerase sigma-70 factor (ECF subfamily)